MEDNIIPDGSLLAWAAARAADRATSSAPRHHGAASTPRPDAQTRAPDGPARRWITLLRRLPLATFAIGANPRRP